MTCIQKEEKARNVNDHRYPIKRIPDELWDEFKKVLPKEKSSNTVGRPIVPYRKVLDGILYVLPQVASRKCYLKNMVQVQHVIDDFKNKMAWIYSKTFGLNY